MKRFDIIFNATICVTIVCLIFVVLTEGVKLIKENKKLKDLNADLVEDLQTNQRRYNEVRMRYLNAQEKIYELETKYETKR